MLQLQTLILRNFWRFFRNHGVVRRNLTSINVALQ